MSDLIERDDVTRIVQDRLNSPYMQNKWQQGACLSILRAIEELPSARPKDEWIARRPSEKGLGVVYECPFCEYEVDCVPTNFCPNCGADMREREGE